MTGSKIPAALQGAALYLDCFAGVAGDMALGALLDLGVPEEVVREELNRLAVSGYRLERSRVRRGALVGTKIDVVIEPGGHGLGHQHEPGHEPGHQHGHGHGQPGASSHTHYREIRALLERSLSGEVLARALDIFDRIAKVEAHLHGVAVAEVAFHEVGAIDSIVDVVGVAAALAWLRPAQVTSRRVPLGEGMVETAHGRLPVPAPATLELLAGAEVEAGGVQAELTTPTGAAIVAATAGAFGPLPPMQVLGVGWGAGERELSDRPNLLRVVAGRSAVAAHASAEELVVLEANVDDMNPELAEPLFEALFAAGALDVWMQSMVMKKGRPGLLVGALCEPAAREQVAAALLRESTSIGVRFSRVERTLLERRLVDVHTPYGVVPMKVAGAPGEMVNAAPEYEVCRRLARERGVAVKLVYLAALGEFYRLSQ